MLSFITISNNGTVKFIDAKNVLKLDIRLDALSDIRWLEQYGRLSSSHAMMKMYVNRCKFITFIENRCCFSISSLHVQINESNALLKEIEENARKRCYNDDMNICMIFSDLHLAANNRNEHFGLQNMLNCFQQKLQSLYTFLYERVSSGCSLLLDHTKKSSGSRLSTFASARN